MDDMITRRSPEAALMDKLARIWERQIDDPQSEHSSDECRRMAQFARQEADRLELEYLAIQSARAAGEAPGDALNAILGEEDNDDD